VAWWDNFNPFAVDPAYADWQSIQPKGVAYVESRGMTPEQKKKPGKAGELGTYQLTPIAYRDLQRLNSSYKNQDFATVALNDQTAQQAMKDYMKALQNNYFFPWAHRTPTDAELLQMYNVGPTAYKRGVRNPKYVQTYQRGVKE